MMPTAAVIVVAGGRSTRFGADKLRHRIDGRTLLERTVDAAAAVGDVVLVTAADDAPAGVSVAVSENPRWGGPCAAIAAGVDAASAVDAATDALILPADLADPWSTAAALTRIDEGVLTDADGHPQWLAARVPLAALIARVAELRRDRGTLAGLSARDLLGGIPGRRPVPGAVCADIDTPADLAIAFPAVLEKEPVHGTV